MATMGKQQLDRFVLISSAGLDRIKPDYSDYLKDVLSWKMAGELSLKASGVPYSIVRAYSLNNEAEDAGDDFTGTSLRISLCACKHVCVCARAHTHTYKHGSRSSGQVQAFLSDVRGG